MISKPIKVKALENYNIIVSFEDGVEGEVDLSFLRSKGVFEIWSDYEIFKKVYIDPETFSIAWNKEVEIDSNNLYLSIIGKTYEQWSKEKLEYASEK